MLLSMLSIFLAWHQYSAQVSMSQLGMRVQPHFNDEIGECGRSEPSGAEYATRLIENPKDAITKR